MVPRSVRKNVHKSGDQFVDFVPIIDRPVFSNRHDRQSQSGEGSGCSSPRRLHERSWRCARRPESGFDGWTVYPCIASKARAERMPSSYQTGSPLGERAECGRDRPRGFADDLGSGGGPKKLTSSAGAGASVAKFFRCLIQADLAVGKANAQGLGFACVLPFLGRERYPPGKRMEGSSGKLAKVIIIAGMLLSQVATPIRARAVGSGRARA